MIGEKFRNLYEKYFTKLVGYVTLISIPIKLVGYGDYLRISTKGRYGVNAMFILAQEAGGDPVSLKTISSQLSMPMPYLEQIIIKLRKRAL